MPLLEAGRVDYDGEAFTAHMASPRPGDRAPSVMVAALGEQALRVTGRRTDGTILWMVGPRTIEDHIRPRLADAAGEVDRPDPRIVASLPVCVTSDTEAVREAAAEIFAIYGQLPSYRAMLDREGAASPGDVAIIGNEEEVAAGLEDMARAGATDFVALEFGRTADEFAQTRSLLAGLA
jgi:F420-dependent oxidoreductase-like protein